MPAVQTKPRTVARGPRAGKARRRPARVEQLDLELEPEGTLDQRIQWARTTAGNYEEMAAKETDPELRARFQRRGASWNKNVLDLMEERRQRNAQMDFFTTQ